MKKPVFVLFFILCSLLISCVQYLDDFILIIKNDSSLDLRISIEPKWGFPEFNKDVEIEIGDSVSLYEPPSDAKYFALMPTSPPFQNYIEAKITFSNLETGEIIKEMDSISIRIFKSSNNKGKGLNAGGFRQEYLLTVTDSLLFEN